MATTDASAISSADFARIQQMISQQQASTGRPLTTDEISGLIQPIISAGQSSAVAMESQNIQKGLAQQSMTQQAGQFMASEAERKREFDIQQQNQAAQIEAEQATARTSGMLQVGSTLLQAGILGKSLGVFGGKAAATSALAPAATTGGAIAPIAPITGTAETAAPTATDAATTATATTGTDFSWLSSAAGYVGGAALIYGGITQMQAGQKREGFEMTGAGIGAMIGTFILPGLGTLIGAGIGAVAGDIGSAIKLPKLGDLIKF